MLSRRLVHHIKPIQTFRGLCTVPEQEKKEPIMKRFKTFMKQYGYIGMANYWATWGMVVYGAYLGGEFGLVNYSDWQFLHLDKVEQIYEWGAGKLGYDTDIHPITPKTENMIVAFMFGKITKPIQWAWVGVTTPPLARYLGMAPEKKLKK